MTSVLQNSQILISIHFKTEKRQDTLVFSKCRQKNITSGGGGGVIASSIGGGGGGGGGRGGGVNSSRGGSGSC